MDALERFTESVQRELGAAARFGWTAADADPSWLDAAERAAVAKAVEQRQREFTAGRLLAKRLLGELGFPTRSLPADAHRRPVWPEGTLGSISHADGTVSAFVARSDALLAAGLDLERDETLERELWPEIATPTELARILAEPDDDARGRLALRYFSAKESVYKAQHPLTSLPFGFQDVEIELDPPNTRFFARKTNERGPATDPGWLGTQLRGGGWLVSALIVPRPRAVR
jgi:4'-phosphopantetheinyl transferase EntD